jgi:hypothetical protein
VITTAFLRELDIDDEAFDDLLDRSVHTEEAVGYDVK